jgi:hypothetical protein
VFAVEIKYYELHDEDTAKRSTPPCESQEQNICFVYRFPSSLFSPSSSFASVLTSNEISLTKLFVFVA